MNGSKTLVSYEQAVGRAQREITVKLGNGTTLTLVPGEDSVVVVGNKALVIEPKSSNRVVLS